MQSLLGREEYSDVGTGDCCPKLEISRHAGLGLVGLTRDLENIQPCQSRIGPDSLNNAKLIIPL
jgi:hypothetical protein